jgi:8-amino-7-oxononanoate synthase
LGSHGAIILGSSALKAYLINFARSFIYTTAPSLHQLATAKMAYTLLGDSASEILALRDNIGQFKNEIKAGDNYPLINSDSAIQCIILKNNDKARALANELQANGLDVRAILSPTVPAGLERLRICLHAFNTGNEISLLTNLINKYIHAE